MLVKIQREIDLPVSIDRAWLLINDVPSLVGCIPGAVITKISDDRHFAGELVMRVGPARMHFGGQLAITNVDVIEHTLNIIGNGKDRSGNSSATLAIKVHVVDDNERARVLSQSEIEVMGKVASVGARFLPAIANELIDEFVGNLQKRLATAPKPNIVDDASDRREVVIGDSNELSFFKFLWRLLRRWAGRRA